MNNTAGIICEIIVLIFNILIYMKLTVLKKDTKPIRWFMYIGSALILAAFFLCTYFLKMPETLASFACVTIPSFALFFALSKYKDFRFLVTFCFLDTVTLILTFFARMADILGGRIAGIISYVIIVIAMLLIYLKGKAFFAGYRELMKNVNDGWASVGIATLAIYFLQVFSASYPKPLIERTEYLVSYAVLSITILTVYVVFVLTMLQKKTLSDLNKQLTEEKKWHRIAYEDALTGLKNRMAYMKTINTLERELENKTSIHAIMIDIDQFKRINDTHGHHTGDITLQRTAEYLRNSLSEENYRLFRIGGDEFAAIAIDLSEQEVAEKIEQICKLSTEKIGCSVSIGMCKVNPSNNRALEVAFEIADKKMYQQKMSKTTV